MPCERHKGTKRIPAEAGIQTSNKELFKSLNALKVVTSSERRLQVKETSLSNNNIRPPLFSDSSSYPIYKTHPENSQALSTYSSYLPIPSTSQTVSSLSPENRETSLFIHSDSCPGAYWKKKGIVSPRTHDTKSYPKRPAFVSQKFLVVRQESSHQNVARTKSLLILICII